MQSNPFPHDSSYGQAEHDAAEWQRDSDVADDAERLQTSLESHRDYVAEIRGDQQRDNNKHAI